MQITYAHLCDYALVADSKLSVLGIFSVLRVQVFPAIHAQAYLAYELELAAAEVGRPVQLEVRVRDADGRDIAQIRVEIGSQGTAPPGTKPKVRHIIPIQHMKFEKAGRYEFAFFLDGHYNRSIELEIVRLQKPGDQPPSP